MRSAGAFAGPPAARPQGLCAARSGGRMHGQGQSPGAIRVWLQGLGGDPGHQAQRRSVCTARQGTARQPLRRPHTGADRHGTGSADRGRDPSHSRRQKPAPAKAGGYRGHNHAQKFRVWISGQVRRVTAPIRREMRRRAAVEPVIGHMKAEHRMGRNYLKGRDAPTGTARAISTKRP